jgi:hypothetical protein
MPFILEPGNHPASQPSQAKPTCAAPKSNATTPHHTTPHRVSWPPLHSVNQYQQPTPQPDCLNWLLDSSRYPRLDSRAIRNIMLAQQLEAHRSRTGNVTGATQTKWRPSVLMDPREAADLDIATVRDIAVNGFAELVMLAPALSDFEAPLFGASLSASTERHMLDPAAAAALQSALDRFLAMVSPFLQHRCALKVLDFLLRRHHVHVHNADAVMLSVLPYHETDLFVKVRETQCHAN